MIANYFVQFAGLSQIWFVVSPQNPFKVKDELLDENKRLDLINLAIGNDERFKASQVEFELPRPSYTINTLNYLAEAYPQFEFVPIIGGDNLQHFDKWKDYQLILNKYEVYVYRRAGFYENPLLANHPKIKIFEVPLLNISSTYIREMIQADKSIKYLVPEKVEAFIKQAGYYK